MKQHLKDAKHARTKAAKRERLNPKPQKHWAFPAGITLLLFSLVYAATNFGSVNTTKHSPQATQIPLVTPANAGVHESALLTNANYTPNQSVEDNFSRSSNVPAVVKNISSATTSRTYQYNNREQLVSMTEDAVTTTYLYDGNGNRVSVKVGDAPAITYVWGPTNQLVSASTGETYEYDSAGHRTAINFGGNRTEYVWSGDELVAETNVLGNTISQITRAGPLVFGEVRNGVAHYYDVDAYNSIIVGTLTDGTVSGRLSYRAFGQVRTATGSIQTPFRFNGYISDGGDELSSPSRYYSLSTGRFTSMDPAAPLPMDPISWNAYVGLGANPMTYIDPDGRIKILSNGTAMMSEWRGWLANRAGEVDRSWYGKATAAGVGVGNALIGITEFGLGGVNAIANASVVAHATVAGAVGLDTRFADNAASELMSTQAAAAGLYTTATTDAKYQAYDHAVSVGADAFGGNQTAIAHSSEFITSLALPSELGTVRLGAIEERAVALAGAMELELARVQAFNRAGIRGSSAPYVVQEGGNGGVIMCRDGCFVAGTPVLTAEGLKPIEHLQIGELVAAKNELTGATAWQRIENIFITHDREIWNLSFVDAAGIIEVITSTPNHPFALISGGWQDAAKLVPGDQIATLDGRVVRLLTSQMDPGSATTYNLMVAVDHTYFVGHAGLWVHNQVDCCPGAKLPTVPVAALDVGTYSQLTSRRVVGDQITPDHQPSGAAIIRDAETRLGRKLLPSERKTLYECATCIAVPESIHGSYSRTYKGRNSQAVINKDALDLSAAAVADEQFMKNALVDAGYDQVKVDEAFRLRDKLNEAIWGGNDGN